MNLLGLVQRAVQESGTMSGPAVPTTAANQTGRLLKCVNWVISAYEDIQNMHETWLWMRAEFSAALTIGTARYTSASFSLTRWARWITTPRSLTIYDPAIGVADEGELALISYEYWRVKYGRGAQTNQRPIEYAVSPTGELCFGPIPDKAYAVRGEYQKSPQTLAANTDIPEMPSQFHLIIVWQALLYIDEHDEGSVAKAQRRRQDLYRSLMKSQLPEIKIGGDPIA